MATLLLIVLNGGYKLAISLRLIWKLRRLGLLECASHEIEEVLALAQVAPTLLTLDTAPHEVELPRLALRNGCVVRWRRRKLRLTPGQRL